MSFNQVSHINLFSENNKQLIRFYKSLGMESFGDDQSDSWHGFNTEGTTFAIEPMTNREKVSKEINAEREDDMLIQFKASTAEELKQMTEKLISLNVKVVWNQRKVSYGTVTNFFDPDGNLMEILLESN